MSDARIRPSGPSVDQWILAGVFIVLFLYAYTQIAEVVEQRTPQARAEAMLTEIGGLAVHRPLPQELADYPLEGVNGQGPPVRLGDLKGKTVFLNYWATWCEPCIREIPSMLALARELPRSQFRMVAVSYDDSWEPVVSFFNQYTGGLPPELLLARDAKGQDEGSLRLRMGTEKLPETYIVRDGMILHKFISNHDWADPRKKAYFRMMTQGGSGR